MKKIFALLLCTVLLAASSLMPALAEDAPLLGGWEPYADNPTDIPADVLSSLNNALADLTGCTYDPVALLATQVVSGTNYCILCKCTVVTPDAPVSYVLLYLYQPLTGNPEILRVQTLDYSVSE